MNKFRPFQYIKKYIYYIIGLFVILTIGLYFVLNKMQSYTAEIVIDYVYEEAKNGLTPDFSKLDVNEIYSSSIISQALNNLGVDQKKYPIDQVRSSIEIHQIEDEAVSLVNESINKEGETSDLQPTKYVVSYTVGSDSSGYMARVILNEIMDIYFSEFSRKYINRSTVTNTSSDINESVYDYIEQMELIEESVKNAEKGLQSRAKNNPTFYSADTGYSFSQLANEFSLLKKTQVSSLYAYILKHRVTQDREKLINKYEGRLESSKIEQKQNKVRVSEVEGILDTYVQKLRDSRNTAQSEVIEGDNATLYKNNVLGDVETPNYKSEDGEWSAYDQTTEYEKLLQNWIDISIEYNTSVIETGYFQYIIDCFKGNNDGVIKYQNEVSQIKNQSGSDVELGVVGELVNADNLQNQLSTDIYTEKTVKCTKEDIEFVERNIAELLKKMDELYAITRKADAEYNDYLGSEHIQVVSSSQIYKGVKVYLYTLIGAIAFLGVGCLGAIILGRMGDIIEYIAFTDQKYLMANRVSCDRYIKKFSRKVLPVRFGCVFFQIMNQNEINFQFGREIGDEVIMYFANGIKSLFKKDDNFVAYNGSGQFIIFLQNEDAEKVRMEVENLRVVLHEQLKEKGIVLQYSAGVAVSSDVEIYHIRGLIGNAMKTKEKYVVGEGR